MKIRLHSVRLKLLIMVLVANFFTLLVAGGVLFYHDFMENRSKAVAELTALASILAHGSSAALEFDDKKVAEDNLRQLEANPAIVNAAIYTRTGAIFARYALHQSDLDKIPPAPKADAFDLNGDQLWVFQDILSPQQEPLGTVYLKKQYFLSNWVKEYVVILSSVMAASLILGVLISNFLQRWISDPIAAVSNVARKVMAERDFHLRATKSTEDEVGQLADAFNGMLNTLEHEIAERTIAENEVRNFNAELEGRVAKRTIELQNTNQQLVARTQEAETANRAKADFLANMSHEIRTPMNAVLGFAYLLEQNKIDESSLSLVKKIRSAGKSLQSIINDILDFSKIEAGHLEIEVAPFNLVDILENVGGIMAANTGEKELELVISPAPELSGQLYGDSLRLEQVLLNLTSNAIKFTDTGSVIVSIALQSQEKDSVLLRFSVKDTGIGVAQEKQKQIFTAFSQEDVSTTRRFGGTGLGLAISRHLVTKMGGQIGVISEVGKGSEFWFTLPFMWDKSVVCEPSDLVGLEVLVVDDSDVARENIFLTAQSIGWRPTKAESGEVAIEKIEHKLLNNSEYDVLLVDWKMPDMDGLELAKRVRAKLKGAASPIVLMVTAFSRDELIKQSSANYIDGILDKPITASTLYNIVAEVISQKERSTMGLVRPLKGIKGRRVSGIRVLVVDDSEINREVAKGILIAEGAVVHLANDGRQAIDWLRNNQDAVDVVLMDVQMPVMDGYEATSLLRLMPTIAHLPVIALSAGAFRAQQEAATESGMDAFVPKPFDVDVLIDTIRKLIPGYKSLGPAAKPGVQQPVSVDTLPLSDGRQFPGLDLEKARGVWSDFDTYRRYLQRFSVEYQPIIGDLDRLFRQNNYEHARRLLHKFKGVAGNLAIVDVHRISAALELLDDLAESLTMLSELETALRIAFDSILQFVGEDFSAGESTPGQPEPAPDMAELKRYYAELLLLLDKDSPDPLLDYLHSIETYMDGDELSQLREYIDNFDFRGAESYIHTRELSLSTDVKGDDNE